MNLIGIMRSIDITNLRTRREASKFARAVYAPVERNDGRDLSRTKNSSMGTPIRKAVLRILHQMEGGGSKLVSLSAVIPVELNRENK